MRATRAVKIVSEGRSDNTPSFRRPSAGAHMSADRINLAYRIDTDSRHREITSNVNTSRMPLI